MVLVIRTQKVHTYAEGSPDAKTLFWALIRTKLQLLAGVWQGGLHDHLVCAGHTPCCNTPEEIRRAIQVPILCTRAQARTRERERERERERVWISTYVHRQT